MSAALPVKSQELTTEDKYLRRLKVNDAIEPLGATPFGEQINMYTGDLTFRQTDVVLDGNGPTISISRELVSVQTSDIRMGPSSMGNWVLAIPRIETLTQAPWGTGAVTNPGDQWTVGNPLTGARCTSFDRPRYTGGLNDPEAAWNGMELISESGERQGILKRGPGSPAAPSMLDANGNPMVFTALTLGNWQIACLPTTSNGEAGEGFLAVAPNGIKYKLDYLTGERTYAEFERRLGATFRQFRMFANMYVSRVEDRFGNYVDYHYTGDKLTSITASDGRSVGLVWRTDAPVISQVIVNPGTAQQRLWQYQYNVGTTGAVLTGVVLPDGTAWQFSLSGLGGRALTHPQLSNCGLRTLPSQTTGGMVSTVVHPSGAVGTFVVRDTWHSRAYVPSNCVIPYDTGGDPYEGIPAIFGTGALVSKTMSGPGLTPATWNYSYSPAAGSTTHDVCAVNQTCPQTRWVDVTTPEGDRTRYTYSVRWGAHEGKLLKTELYEGSSTLVRTEVLNYMEGNEGLYPAQVGIALSGYNSNYIKQEIWTPEKSKVITQQGRTFTWEVAASCGSSNTSLCFDTLARPTKVTKTSAAAP